MHNLYKKSEIISNLHNDLVSTSKHENDIESFRKFDCYVQKFKKLCSCCSKKHRNLQDFEENNKNEDLKNSINFTSEKAFIRNVS